MELRIERKLPSHVPWALLIATASIAALGVVNLASAGRAGHSPLWMSQSMYIGVGLVAMVVVALVDHRMVQQLAVPIYVANLLALIALRFIGHKAKGAESWFALGPLRVQPAEFMKIGMILMLAKIYQHDFRKSAEPYGFLRLWKPVVAIAVPLVLVLAQPDLGTAMMLALSGVTIVLFGGVRWWVSATMAVGFLLVSGIIWNDYVRDQAEPRQTFIRHRLKKHQSDRISSWLDPESDPKGKNYHSAQSKIAVGSGGVTGKGWKEGTQTGLSFLPEQHTDFIFSVWAEEHGFIACVLLLALYAVVFTAALGVGFQSRDRFGAFVAVGVAAMLFWQVFENIGMVTGLLPVTGITLPLMSYGGSSMLSVMIGIGLLVNVSLHRHIF